MKHNWKFNKGDVVINITGTTCKIKDRWLDECSKTGEWYALSVGGSTSGSGWKKVAENAKSREKQRI